MKYIMILILIILTSCGNEKVDNKPVIESKVDINKVVDQVITRSLRDTMSVENDKLIIKLKVPEKSPSYFEMSNEKMVYWLSDRTLTLFYKIPNIKLIQFDLTSIGGNEIICDINDITSITDDISSYREYYDDGSIMVGEKWRKFKNSLSKDDYNKIGKYFSLVK